ncbi:hypothetical protein ACO0M4_31260 [Streptomyces sp. RGM 3693]|uniref:hypothetical protein n=1 Tax=Streptomyces sp. RGM 3693 TaxID=3413284 RepID=UPI003D2B5149
MPVDKKQPIPSAWTRSQRRKREQPALSPEQIVSAAVRLLDEEGIDALSMRNLGEAAWLTMLARSGKDEQDWMEHLWPAAEEAAQDHPQLREQYASLRGKDPREMRDDKFAYGLQRVLDGLAGRIVRISE